jgi:hypothetical protein
MSQVGMYYVFKYHLKASRGIPLVAKIAGNLVKSFQSWVRKSKNFFRNAKS